jgi:hypothetical protein
MALKLTAPIEKDFILEKTDKEYDVKDDHTTVRIRQATQGQCEVRNALLSEFTRVFDGDQLTVSQHFSPEELYRREVELTMVGCNIENDNGKPTFFFKDGKVDPASFKRGWAGLPPIVAEEIHDKVLEMNPLWAGPMGEA